MIKQSYLKPVAVVVGLILVGYVFFHGIKMRNYHDDKVSTGELWRPFNLVFAHMERPPYLTVRGKTYVHVRGLPPHYLNVPNSSRILFAANKGYSCVIYIVDLVSGVSVEIPGNGSSFGGNVGGIDRPAGGAFTDWIESASNDEIVLATRNDITKVRIVLDLARRVVKQQETVPLNPNGGSGGALELGVGNDKP